MGLILFHTLHSGRARAYVCVDSSLACLPVPTAMKKSESCHRAPWQQHLLTSDQKKKALCALFVWSEDLKSQQFGPRQIFFLCFLSGRPATHILGTAAGTKSAVVLAVYDLKTQHQQSSTYRHWPGLFWALPVMTACGERSESGL